MPKKGEQVFSPRDNTRTRFVPEVGFQPEREVRPRDVRLDDGITGYLPVVGDILQAGQAILDLRNKEYGKAALGAGMLLLPNVLDKPIKQVLKNGAKRVLRREPGMTLHLFDADHPYRGTNFLHHGTAYSDDILGNAADGVLEGETRAMSPSFAINRIGDFNDISKTPGRYWDAFFIGDKSLLDDAIIYRGDGNTPILSDVDVNPTHLFGSIPSAAREEAAERLWQNTLSGPWKGSGPTITVPDLDVVDQPDIKYFEAKIHGTVPLDKMRHGVFLDPKYSDNPKKAEKVIQAYSDRGLPVSLYNGTRDGWAETYLDILNNNPDILFKCGGQMNKYPGGGRFFLAGTPSSSVPGTLLTVPTFTPSVSSSPVVEHLDLGPVVDRTPVELPNPAAPIVIPGRELTESFDMSRVQPSVPSLDPVADAARRIMEVENSKANLRGGWNAVTKRWYPHRSHEGGADTIAYGIKLSNGSPEAALALKQGYLTDEQAVSAVDSLVRKHYDAAKKVYDKKYGEGEWDKLSDKSQSILVDYSYNPGLAKFPKLMEGFHSGNMDLIRENYKRYSGGKELGRNKTLLKEIDTLGSEYPIFRAGGGKIHIAESKKGTFTAAASKHGKSVQAFASQVLANKENYSPAMVKKANFARNAAKWKKADGGYIDIPDGVDREMLLQAIREVKNKKLTI